MERHEEEEEGSEGMGMGMGFVCVCVCVVNGSQSRVRPFMSHTERYGTAKEGSETLKLRTQRNRFGRSGSGSCAGAPGDEWRREDGRNDDC